MSVEPHIHSIILDDRYSPGEYRYSVDTLYQARVQIQARYKARYKVRAGGMITAQDPLSRSVVGASSPQKEWRTPMDTADKLVFAVMKCCMCRHTCRAQGGVQILSGGRVIQTQMTLMMRKTPMMRARALC